MTLYLRTSIVDTDNTRGGSTMKCLSLLQDVENLQETHSSDAKAKITEKISYYFNEALFDESEMIVAEEVLRLLARDTERKVQLTLANTLKSNPHLPHDVALSLAKGATEVAVPILEFSSVLTDEDLIEIIRSTKELARWSAIAKRESLSVQVSSVLIETKSENVINTLLNNSNAQISEKSILQILNSFSDNNQLMEALVSKGGLPLSIVGKIATTVSSALQKKLLEEYPNFTHIEEKNEMDIEKSITTASSEAREKLIVEFLSHKGREHDAQELVNHLLSVGSLSPSIILRGLCKGDLSFFIHGISKLSGVPVEATRKFVLDKTSIGFAKIYEKAGLPKSMYEPVKIVLKFALDEIEKGTILKDGYAARIVGRIIDGGYDNLMTSMPYLMVLINSPLSDETP